MRISDWSSDVCSSDLYKKELAGLRHRAFGLDEIVGESDPIRRLKSEIRKIAPLDVPVFISGESGSGKELVAHAIHNLSRRVERPMVVVNCGSLTANLVESRSEEHTSEIQSITRISYH